MIRVELIEEVKRRGIWRYSIDGVVVEKLSRQPLLDACRVVKRAGGDTSQRIGLFRAKRPDIPDLSCSVGWGAAHTVDENGSRFVKWRPFTASGLT